MGVNDKVEATFHPDEGLMRTFVTPGWRKRTVYGPVAILDYPNGDAGVEHVCKRTRTGGEPMVGAPLLQLGVPGGHVIQQTAPLTVYPSIACGDCDLHGFITNGEWVPA